jgi:hypothetical protein
MNDWREPPARLRTATPRASTIDACIAVGVSQRLTDAYPNLRGPIRRSADKRPYDLARLLTLLARDLL